MAINLIFTCEQFTHSPSYDWDIHSQTLTCPNLHVNFFYWCLVHLPHHFCFYFVWSSVVHGVSLCVCVWVIPDIISLENWLIFSYCCMQPHSLCCYAVVVVLQVENKYWWVVLESAWFVFGTEITIILGSTSLNITSTISILRFRTILS